MSDEISRVKARALPVGCGLTMPDEQIDARQVLSALPAARPPRCAAPAYSNNGTTAKLAPWCRPHRRLHPHEDADMDQRRHISRRCHARPTRGHAEVDGGERRRHSTPGWTPRRRSSQLKVAAAVFVKQPCDEEPPFPPDIAEESKRLRASLGLRGWTRSTWMC